MIDLAIALLALFVIWYYELSSQTSRQPPSCDGGAKGRAFEDDASRRTEEESHVTHDKPKETTQLQQNTTISTGISTVEGVGPGSTVVGSNVGQLTVNEADLKGIGTVEVVGPGSTVVGSNVGQMTVNEAVPKGAAMKEITAAGLGNQGIGTVEVVGPGSTVVGYNEGQITVNEADPKVGENVEVIKKTTSDIDVKADMIGAALKHITAAGLENQGSGKTKGMSYTAQQQAGWDKDMMAAYNGQELSQSTHVNKEDNTILHIACLSPRHNDKQIDRYLSNPERIDIDSLGENGYTPVMMACRVGKEAVYRVILKYSPNLLIKDEDDNSIIHIACMGGCVAIVEDILKRFPDDIDLRGENGLTPVMIAAIQNKPEVVDHLIKKGCNRSLKDNLERNLLHCACIGGNIKLVDDCIKSKEFDIDSNKDWYPVLISALHGYVRLFDKLQEDGFDISCTGKSGNTVLHIAVYNERLDFIKHLQTKDLLSACGREKKNKSDATPYDVAVRLGFTEIGLIVKVDQIR